MRDVTLQLFELLSRRFELKSYPVIFIYFEIDYPQRKTPDNDRTRG
ncbi:hypothetical protein DESC_530010 [Desulfosarcina cetonica]|nr:hypothetical protein DESC_530010 [Desulfosarcina cetonica]